MEMNMETNSEHCLPHQQLSYGIGDTPVQAAVMTIGGVKRIVHLKLEGFNSTCSMKDRTAFALIQALESRYGIQREATIIESTSGNLGVALARLCQMKGYRFIAVIDPKTTAENVARMQAFGAQVLMVRQADQTGGYLLTRLACIKQLLRKHPDYYWTDQYANPANPLAHYRSTGPEIYRQMQQQVDAIFVPVSTGGTLAGIGKFFREVSPSTRIIGVDAYGSVIFGTQPSPRKLTGIGSSQTSSFLQKDLYDEAMLVEDERAFAFCRLLYTSLGIFVGGSSGAVLAACASYLARHPEKQRIVCVCADHGEHYRSTIFNEGWLQEQGIELYASHLEPLERIHGDVAE